MSGDLDLVVSEVHELGGGVREVVFAGPDTSVLPKFTPGSHISVTWAPGQRNSYSLTNSGTAPSRYVVAVLRKDDGHGGSCWMHNLSPGACVYVTPPRNAFEPIATARRHVYVAGGIGVTPLIAHVRAAVQWRRDFQMIYRYRDGYGAYVGELRRLCGPRMVEPHDREMFYAEVRAALSDQPLGTHLYVCGPAPMIADTVAMASDLGWPSQRVHIEAFASTTDVTGESFTAHLTRSGVDVDVRPGQGLLEALLEQGVPVPHLCCQGVCGECRTEVVSGAIDHRDSYLTDIERDEGRSIMPCVSRAAGRRLELDL